MCGTNCDSSMFVENMLLALSTLRVNFFSKNQMLSFSNFLLFSCSILIAGKFSMIKYIVVSSAYMRNTSLLVNFTMSFVNTLKNKGPRIDP